MPTPLGAGGYPFLGPEEANPEHACLHSATASPNPHPCTLRDPHVRLHSHDTQSTPSTHSHTPWQSRHRSSIPLHRTEARQHS